MSNIWIVTDTHFNHKKMCELQGRPENFNEVIIKNWQEKVQPEDQVWHLGDVILGQMGTLTSILEQLPGKKILIKGNHDKEKTQWYIDHGFTFVCYGFQYRKIWFTHHPARMLPEGCNMNIFGHFHGNDHRLFDEEAGIKLRKWHKHLHIEETLSPILLSEFLETHAKQEHGMLPF